jgi:hypothetical protein
MVSWDWQTAESTWSWILALKGIVSIATLSALWRALAAALKWNRERYHGKVLSYMSETDRKERLDHSSKNLGLLRFPISLIAKALNRPEQKVYKSLRIFEAQGKVHEAKHGEWSLGNQTQREILNKLSREAWRGANRWAG